MKNKLEDIFSLANKVIIITGAAGLLGKKHAEAVCAFDGIPILLDIDKEKLKLLADELQRSYLKKVHYLVVDITSEDRVREASDYVVNIFGKVDGLINNAANNPKPSKNGEDFSRLEKFNILQWNKDIAVGLTGAFLCSKYFGKEIASNNNGGVIINISSDLGLIAPDQNLYKKEGLHRSEQSVKPVTYSVVKTGIIGLTRYLATYWAEDEVRANALCPGGVEDGQDELFLANVIKKIPMGRMAEDNEYQGVIVWMLSDASKYLNGAIIPVDGGRTAW